MGFYMGKFIYLLDAYEDLKQDQKKGNYNPLAYVQMESKEEYETFCRSTLTCLMAECAKSFERMPILQLQRSCAIFYILVFGQNMNT